MKPLNENIDARGRIMHLKRRFGMSLKVRFSRQIEELISKGLLEWFDKEGESIRLTRRGRLLGNQVFMEFIE